MKIDFSLPQRQSLLGVGILFLYLMGKFLKNFWFVFVIIFTRENTLQRQLFIGGCILLLMVGAAVIAFIQYRNFTYHLNPETGEFVIEKAIVNKSITVIERHKIQEVTLNQPFFHKILGIYQVEIDSPGTDKKELRINAVAAGTAKQLREALMAGKTDKPIPEMAAADSEAPVQTKEQFRISVVSLIKWGFTSDYIYSIFALIGVIFYLYDKLSEYFMTGMPPWMNDQLLQDYILWSNILIVAGVFLFLVTAVFINAVRKIIRFWDARISMVNERMKVSYGLFNSRETMVNPEKVQIFCVTQNPLQKKMDVLSLKITQIGEDEDEEKTSTIVPACNSKEKDVLQKFLFGGEVVFQEAVKPVKRRLFYVLAIWAILVPLCILPFLYFLEFPMYFSIIISIFVSPLIVLKYRNSTLFFGENYIRERSGIWDVDERMARVEDAQMVEVSQFFWQRKRNTGAVTVYTAGGSLGMESAPLCTLKRWTNYIIFKAENKNWNV
ncbi:PH domain-containing protein [Chryseobacterium sp. MFBS3-17]|uniref:PH domain-containing protein n=1 Tax=Chryseobacterium sp. MFBS3-17 TaxID=2886689 RepID=UPI001D0DD2D0|nr:PH domain-containing protein [Chryseobacterium sp. MFBS3-17]MCC2589798.1 PH domain-containing protein [Chryseobacterium sp. MFBS3-17]